MDIATLSLVAVAAIIIFLLVQFLRRDLDKRDQTTRLRDQFGSEYQRAVNKQGDQEQAEDELANRLLHAKSLDLLPLTDDQKADFRREWQLLETQFVRDPAGVLREADHMIKKVMGAKGYPTESFEKMAEDLSVDYPDHVENYRNLHILATRAEYETISRDATQQALQRCRVLFEELLDSDVTESTILRERT